MIKSVLITFGILIAITSFLFTGYTSLAQVPVWFGGKITQTDYCPYSANFLLTFSKPFDKQLVWYPGTPQLDFKGLPREGVWALGTYIPGGVCLKKHKRKVRKIGQPVGTITPMVGTSR